MDQAVFDAKKYLDRAVKFLKVLVPWIPLILAGETLLAGILPMASAPWVSRWTNVYQLPAAALTAFLIFPLVLGILWLMERYVKDFARLAKTMYAVAAAVQVVSLFFLSAAAGRVLEARMSDAGLRGDVIPQNLGLAFFFLLIPTAAFLIYSGVHVLHLPVGFARQKKQVPIAVDVQNPWAPPAQQHGQTEKVYYGENRIEFYQKTD
jgi:hypothetical protein